MALLDRLTSQPAHPARSPTNGLARAARPEMQIQPRPVALSRCSRLGRVSEVLLDVAVGAQQLEGLRVTLDLAAVDGPSLPATYARREIPVVEVMSGATAVIPASLAAPSELVAKPLPRCPFSVALDALLARSAALLPAEVPHVRQERPAVLASAFSLEIDACASMFPSRGPEDATFRASAGGAIAGLA
jgi:hypothetical protein